MKIAGAYQVLDKQLSRTVMLDILVNGASYGPAPYYGEQEYSGRWILEGMNAAKK